MRQIFGCLLGCCVLVITTPLDLEDCELHAPNTMHDFCCDIHDESSEFWDCQMEWHNKLHFKNDEDEQDYMFCTSECVYNKTQYLGADRKSLRMKVIKYHLMELHGDDKAESLMYKTYEMCGKRALAMLGLQDVVKIAQRLSTQNCHPYPGLVFECVSNELIVNCPTEHYHGTAQCDVARDYLRSCRNHNKYKS